MYLMTWIYIYIYVSVYVYVLCIYPNQQDPCFLSGLPVNLGFTYGFGPGNPGFWENPMFFQTRDETVMDPWFTSDNPWITRARVECLKKASCRGWCLLCFFEIEEACGCWCFETKLLGWMLQKNILVRVAKPWVLFENQGFPADPATFPGFVG